MAMDTKAILAEARAYVRANSPRMSPMRLGLQAYENQVYAAKQRGIPWGLTYGQWWRWWQRDDGTGKPRWLRRGNRAGCLMMLRKGDKGPYALGNVYCGTPTDNAADRRRHTPSTPSPECIAAGVAALRAYNAREVIGPDGTRYRMIKDAASAVGVHRRTLERWIGRGTWRYAEG